MIRGLDRVSYEERLKKLGLLREDTRDDMLEVYKIMDVLIKVNQELLFAYYNSGRWRL